MDPQLKALLTTWTFRWEILLPQLLFAALYLSGWFALRRKGSAISTGWRLTSYVGAHVFFVIALMSGIDYYQEFLFFIHMIQHLLLTMVVPALLFWAAPLPIGMWGLPHKLRLSAGRLLNRKSLFRRLLVELSTPGLIWLVFTIALWLWHDPNAYDTAIENRFIHDLEHITFFVAGLLLWWHITGAAPYIHKHRSYVVRLIIVGLTYIQNIILGIGITMYGKLIYQHYATVPRFWGLDPVTDQTYGGLIMWLPGGMMYLIAVIVIIAKMIEASEKNARASRAIDTRKVPTS